MLGPILFAVVEEDVDESAAAAMEDMEVFTTLEEKRRQWRRHWQQQPCKPLVSFLASSELKFPVERPDGDPSSSVSPHRHEESKDY